MSDLFGAPPPPPPAAAKRPRRPAGHAGAAQKSRPAEEPPAVQYHVLVPASAACHPLAPQYFDAGGNEVPPPDGSERDGRIASMRTTEVVCADDFKVGLARQYGLKTLHDGRLVDSGSPEWKLECLASTLLQLGAAEREAWTLGYGTPEDQVALRLRIQAIKTSRG